MRESESASESESKSESESERGSESERSPSVSAQGTDDSSNARSASPLSLITCRVYQQVWGGVSIRGDLFPHAMNKEKRCDSQPQEV